MHDIDIRVALHEALSHTHQGAEGSVIRHEVGIQEGRRRIDVVLLNGHFSGWEIKSDVDTLARLAGQADAYGSVLDFVSIVTTDRYVDRATAILPDWWGVVVAARTGDGKVGLIETRRALYNPEVDAMSLAQLLWRTEAMALLKEMGMAKGLSSKARWYVWRRLTELMTLPELREVVREKIKERHEWPGGQLSRPRDERSQTLATA